MRKLLFLVTLILAACGSDSDGFDTTLEAVQHVPEIVDLKLSPGSALHMQGGGSVVVTAEITYMDAGRDITNLWVVLPDGTSVEFGELFATETGTFTEEFSIPTNQIGVMSVEFWLVDRAGDSSVHHTENFKILGDVQNSAGGIWKGTLSNELTGRSFETHGVITESNSEGRFLIDGTTLFVLRDISVDGGNITATISVSIRPTSEVISRVWQDSGVLTGALVERMRIEGEWTLFSGDFGTVTLEYDDLYERGSDTARVAGIWKSPWGLIYNIDELGEIFAQAESGCVYEGQIQVFHADYNVYRVNLFDGCLVYEVEGLGVLADEQGTDDVLVWMLGEGWFMADALQRQ